MTGYKFHRTKKSWGETVSDGVNRLSRGHGTAYSA
jgi:hypothetical protein